MLPQGSESPKDVGVTPSAARGPSLQGCLPAQAGWWHWAGARAGAQGCWSTAPALCWAQLGDWTLVLSPWGQPLLLLSGGIAAPFGVLSVPKGTGAGGPYLASWASLKLGASEQVTVLRPSRGGSRGAPGPVPGCWVPCLPGHLCLWFRSSPALRRGRALLWPVPAAQAQQRGRTRVQAEDASEERPCLHLLSLPFMIPPC